VVNNRQLSIIICTFNRAPILSECLAALASQISNDETIELIIINNNSTDDTQKVIDQFSSQYSFIKSFIEKKQGLSHARNRGYKEAIAKWVGYIDDDALASLDLIQEILTIIDQDKYNCFGGMYYPWWRFGKPKWLSDTFGQKIPFADEESDISNENYYLSGGIIFFKKEVLEKLKGFKTNLGMGADGHQVGYGEEDELQDRIRAIGGRLGFVPKLRIDHCVMENKLHPNWHLSAAYARGRDTAIIKKRQSFFNGQNGKTTTKRNW